MRFAQLVHELLGALRSAVAQELGSDSQLRCSCAMGEAPGAKRDHDRHGLDAGFGEAVDGSLAAESVLAGQQPAGDQRLQSAGENVGGDALVGVLEQLSEVASIAEHDVAEDQERPRVPERLKAGVDRASGSRVVAHVCSSISSSVQAKV